jgi:hypothetical protein
MITMRTTAYASANGAAVLPTASWAKTAIAATGNICT